MTTDTAQSLRRAVSANLVKEEQENKEQMQEAVQATSRFLNNKIKEVMTDIHLRHMRWDFYLSLPFNQRLTELVLDDVEPMFTAQGFTVTAEVYTGRITQHGPEFNTSVRQYLTDRYPDLENKTPVFISLNWSIDHDVITQIEEWDPEEGELVCYVELNDRSDTADYIRGIENLIYEETVEGPNRVFTLTGYYSEEEEETDGEDQDSDSEDEDEQNAEDEQEE